MLPPTSLLLVPQALPPSDSNPTEDVLLCMPSGASPEGPSMPMPRPSAACAGDGPVAATEPLPAPKPKLRTVLLSRGPATISPIGALGPKLHSKPSLGGAGARAPAARSLSQFKSPSVGKVSTPKGSLKSSPPNGAGFSFPETPAASAPTTEPEGPKDGTGRSVGKRENVWENMGAADAAAIMALLARPAARHGLQLRRPFKGGCAAQLQVPSACPIDTNQPHALALDA
mmetsp:Transcript_144595/g.367058  ORF Transcript_144595/g.367058 Transcript_144595/m.367058 type:complete len:229 (-) Transcript_144595:8-694(-)